MSFDINNLNQNVLKLLNSRGHDTPQKIEEFLYPDMLSLSKTETLNGVTEAGEKILTHIKKGSRIVIYGDYDCDGIGASAILYLTLKNNFNANVEVYIPIRAEQGYGLSLSGAEKVIEEYNPNLIITVDCGVSSVDEIAFLQSKGIEVIVTDHHKPKDTLPDCLIVNPVLQNGFTPICAAGVAFLLCGQLIGFEESFEFVDILAISTIADLVPLIEENRTFAKLGIEILNKNPRMGIKALLKASGHKAGKKINSFDVAFKIAPRLNAAGRLSSAEKAFKLLTETDPFALNIIALELEAENKHRQELCQKTIADCYSMLKSYNLAERRIIVLYNKDWEEGVIGIAASQIASEFKRPVVLLASVETLKGSCRSISGIDIHSVLKNSEKLLLKFGGHSMAAGLSIDQINVDEFINSTDNYIKENFDDSLFLPSSHFDLQLDIDDIDLTFAKQLSLFEPYGIDNYMPIFKTEIEALNFTRIGLYSHIKCAYKKNMEILGFNMLNNQKILNSNTKKEIYYNVSVDEYNSIEKINCNLRSIDIKEIIPDENELFLIYTQKFLPEKPFIKEGLIFPENQTFGSLKIAFCKDTYLLLIKKYPSYNRTYGMLSKCNPVNTILLAPFCETESFAYYNNIEVYDNPPAAYIDYLNKSFAANITVNDIFSKFDVSYNISDDDLRNTYIHLRKVNNMKIAIENLYKELKKGGYTQEKSSFLVQFNIICQLKLLNYQSNSIIKVTNKKTDLNDSEIYKVVKDGTAFKNN